MKKMTFTLLALLYTSGLFAANNLESIYGENDLNINNNYVHIYDNNFGSIIESNISQPYSMDIELANEEIEILTSKNTVFDNENNQYKDDILLLQNHSEELSELVSRIDIVMNSVVTSSVELYNLSKTLTDKEMKQNLQVSIEENRQQKYDLENRQLVLIQKLDSVKDQASVKKRYITVNNLHIRRNLERVNFLKSCIEISNKDTDSLERAVNRSSSLQSDVDAILNTSY